MIKRLTLLTLVALLVFPAFSFAKDMTGKYGLGYFNTDAPVGFRYWATPKLGIDFGIGFQSDPIWVENEEGVEEKESATSFWFDIGFPYVVFPSEQVNFWVRPGFTFGSLDDRSFGSEGLDSKWTQMTFWLTPGAELFFGENFSVEFAHGIAIQMTKYPDDAIPEAEIPAKQGETEYYYGDRAGETETTISTFAADNVMIAFHFYFK